MYHIEIHRCNLTAVEYYKEVSLAINPDTATIGSTVCWQLFGTIRNDISPKSD